MLFKFDLIPPELFISIARGFGSIFKKQFLCLVRIDHIPPQSGRLRLNLFLGLQNGLAGKLFPQQQFLTRRQFGRTGIVRHGKVAVPVKIHLARRFAESGKEFGRQGGGARVHHHTAVPVPRVIAAPIIDKGKRWYIVGIVVVFVINNPPVVLVVQIFIVVVDEMRGIVGILIKLLQGIARKEFAIGFGNAPIELAKKATCVCM